VKNSTRTRKSPAKTPKKHKQEVSSAAAGSISPEATALDPLLMPLIAHVMGISRSLGALRALVDNKIEEVQELYKSTKLVGRKKAANLLEMSESQFDRQVRDGKLANIRINRRTRVTLGDLEKFIEARRMAGRPKRSTTQKKTPKPQGSAPGTIKTKKSQAKKSVNFAKAKTIK
jgi:hypothetical protein